jgi:predicted ATPase
MMLECTSAVWSNRGKRDEVRDLLAPVYDWFTEGFDTLDLEEAKALLDELSVSLGQTKPRGG